MKKLLLAAMVLLLHVPQAFAQQAPDAEPSFGQLLISMLPMFAIVYLIFYFMVTKPQQTKLRQHADLLKALKKGDMVVTAGGVIGRIAGTEKDHILLEVAPNTRIKVETAQVTKRWESKKGEG